MAISMWIIILSQILIVITWPDYPRIIRPRCHGID